MRKKLPQSYDLRRSCGTYYPVLCFRCTLCREAGQQIPRRPQHNCTVQYQEAAKQSLRATSRPHPDRPPPAALSPSLSPAPPPNALVRTTGVRHAAATSPLPAPPPPPPPPPPHLLPRSRPTPFFRHPDASPRRRRRRRGTSRSSRRGRFGRRRRHHQDQDQGRRRLARHGTSSVLDLI